MRVVVACDNRCSFRCITEYLCLVAGRAFGVAVLAEEGETRQAMIEEYVFLPGLFIVAVAAHCALGSAVGVVVFVTLAASCQRLRLKQGLDMAGGAFDRDVGSMERVTRVRVVIESHLSKALRHVAGVAAFSKMPVVVVIVLMAGNACGIHRVTEGVVAMTVGAHQRRVFAGQVERGIAGMVKRCVMPVSRLMAVAALLSAAPIVRIIVGMAAEACRGGVGKGMIGMAVETARCCMAADQREIGLLVVKRHVFPARRRMAIATTFVQRLRVRAVGFVAGYAGRWCRPVLAVGFMAAGALQTIVLSLQREIGVCVRK